MREKEDRDYQLKKFRELKDSVPRENDIAFIMKWNIMEKVYPSNIEAPLMGKNIS